MKPKGMTTQMKALDGGVHVLAEQSSCCLFVCLFIFIFIFIFCKVYVQLEQRNMTVKEFIFSPIHLSQFFFRDKQQGPTSLLQISFLRRSCDWKASKEGNYSKLFTIRLHLPNRRWLTRTSWDIETRRWVAFFWTSFTHNSYRAQHHQSPFYLISSKVRIVCAIFVIRVPSTLSIVFLVSKPFSVSLTIPLGQLGSIVSAYSEIELVAFPDVNKNKGVTETALLRSCYCLQHTK